MEVMLSLADATNRNKETQSGKRGGARIARWDDLEGKPSLPKIKTRLRDKTKKNTDMNGGSYGPIGKMHMRKANWLGLMDRGTMRY